jgi:hypothetical protein
MIHQDLSISAIVMFSIRRSHLRISNRTHVIKSSRKVLCPASVGEISVSRMPGKELFLLPQGIFHRVSSVDILLAPVDDANETEFERIRPAGQDIQSVRASIHQVELR